MTYGDLCFIPILSSAVISNFIDFLSLAFNFSFSLIYDSILLECFELISSFSEFITSELTLSLSESTTFELM